MLTQAEGLLTQVGLNHHNGRFENNSALLRLSNAEDQLKAQEVLRRDLERTVCSPQFGTNHPEWLRNLGAAP